LKLYRKPKITQHMREHPEEFVPKGDYCHGKTRSDYCPFWNLDLEGKYQANGYCHLLEKGDVEIDRDMMNSGAITELDMKTGERKPVESADDMPPFCMSLLWEQCKECCINDELDDIEEEVK
jgi:hypothetical protein